MIICSKLLENEPNAIAMKDCRAWFYEFTFLTSGYQQFGW